MHLVYYTENVNRIAIQTVSDGKKYFVSFSLHCNSCIGKLLNYLTHSYCLCLRAQTYTSSGTRSFRTHFWAHRKMICTPKIDCDKILASRYSNEVSNNNICKVVLG